LFENQGPDTDFECECVAHITGSFVRLPAVIDLELPN